MDSSTRRVVVTGMCAITPLSDQLDGFYEKLLTGTSAITKWRFFDNPQVYSKIGGDLSDYDFKAATNRLENQLPEAWYARLRKLIKKAPFSTRMTMLSAAQAAIDARLSQELDPFRQCVIVAGHNLPERYLLANYEVFLHEDPDWIEGMSAVHSLDTDHAASVGEVLGSKGALYTMGGACASGNVAIRNAMDEILYHDHDMVTVAGAPLDFSMMGLHAMGLMGAISISSFNDNPAQASRAYDKKREGFVPSHGAASIILEDLDHARNRGARIYAELLGCCATSDGCHLPTPSREGQARTMKGVMQQSGVAPEEIDFVCAHATSTPLGDLSELNAIKDAFGNHAKNLKINAPKSMLGHTCWSAPLVETIAAILQMKAGRLHPSINIDELDPEVDLDICANRACDLDIKIFLKNSFGFGGINCCAIYKQPPGM